MLSQKTLKSQVVLESSGLHTGRDCRITLTPAPENTGVVFLNEQSKRKNSTIPALWTNILNTVLCTELRGDRGNKIRTVEHLMSAIRACNLDNVFIHCSDTEVPLLDGSAVGFVDAFRSVGFVEQNAPRRGLKIRKSIRITQDEKWVELSPYEGCRYDMEIDFENPVIGHQSMSFELSYSGYIKDIAPARTFGELKQKAGLHAAGLALGAGPENTLIFNDNTVVSREGKRFDNECVRHKILDAIGDLHLVGAPILGHFKGYKSGHKMHAMLLHAVMESRDLYSWVNVSKSQINDDYPVFESSLTVENTHESPHKPSNNPHSQSHSVDFQPRNNTATIF